MSSSDTSMPGIQDWRITPLVNVSQIFEQNNENPSNANFDRNLWKAKVTDFFHQKLNITAEGTQWKKQIPSLNFTPNHLLVDGQLVRFQGMIQDMFDPEYFMSEYKVRDLKSGKVRLASGRYRDFADTGPREEIINDDAITDERQTFYCVTVPGEAAWVQDAKKKEYAEISNAPNLSTSCSNKTAKRSLDETDQNSGVENTDKSPLLDKKSEGQENMDISEEPDKNYSEASSDGPASKKRTMNQENFSEMDYKQTTGTVNPSSPQDISSPRSLNLPIPNSKGKAVIVKLYDVAEENFSVNEVVDFVGIVSLDPSLSQAPLEGSDEMFAEFQKQENEVRNPPASLVPRIHVLHYSKVVHANPLLHAEQNSFDQYLRNNLNSIQQEAITCRQQLHAMLSKVLLGDTLAADYLICNLISRIYHRRDVLCLGKFSMNLFNVPTHSNYTKRLSTILQLLVTKSHYLPLTVSNLNGLAFIPKKDYHANRLVSGLLQLSANTHLLVDETAMENGQLSADGLKNLTAIGHLISWQKVEYNFNYHQIEFISDVPALVLSDGRSMLPNDTQLMLKPTLPSEPTTVDESLSAVGSSLDSEVLRKFRSYLTVVQFLPYQLNDDVQKAVQEDFVQERRNHASAQQNGGAENGAGNNGEARGMSTDDLHAHLVLARLLGLSYGETTLTLERWENTKRIERSRKQRMAHMAPQRSGVLANPAGLHA